MIEQGQPARRAEQPQRGPDLQLPQQFRRAGVVKPSCVEQFGQRLADFFFGQDRPVINDHAAQRQRQRGVVAEEIEARYEQINDFEQMLTENGTIILKFFLHVSSDEQAVRFRLRIQLAAHAFEQRHAELQFGWTAYGWTRERAGGAVYAATKHAVRVISEGLRQEVKPYDIRTTVISPGAVATELPASATGKR